jgi:hypothetical protein
VQPVAEGVQLIQSVVDSVLAIQPVDGVLGVTCQDRAVNIVVGGHKLKVIIYKFKTLDFLITIH